MILDSSDNLVGNKMIRNIKMYIFGGLLLLCFSREALNRDGFAYYGTWDNITVSSNSGEAHAGGFKLVLWKYEEDFLGHLFEYVGPPFDPPIGKVEDLEIDDVSGKISFSVKMSVGMQYSEKIKDWIPSRNLYCFEGTFRNDVIELIVEKYDGKMEKKINEEKIILKRRDEGTSFWNNMSYEEFEEFYAPIFKARGPKW